MSDGSQNLFGYGSGILTPEVDSGLSHTRPLSEVGHIWVREKAKEQHSPACLTSAYVLVVPNPFQFSNKPRSEIKIQTYG